MPEVTGNSFVDPTTTLDGAINNSVTAVTVDSVAEIPSPGTSRILVWDGVLSTTKELMKVISVAGLVLTVERGIENTSAQSHGDGDPVELVLSKQALDTYLAQQLAVFNYLTAR